MFNSGRKLLCGAVLVAAVGSAVRADVITQWNSEWLDTIRAVGGPPCPLARSQAILFVSVFEAVNSIDRKFEPYIGYIDVDEPASPRAAAAAAAHKVLVTLYPARQAIYDARFAEQLDEIRNDAARDNGVLVGEAAAAQILLARSTDHTDSTPVYTYMDVPGGYRPTPPEFTSPPFNPGWGTTDCWTMVTGDQFRPQGPLGYNNLDSLLRSRGYANQVNEVKSLGSRNSNARTREQTEIAWFWANDRNGTFKPPGHLMDITATLSREKGLSLSENARLFALVGLALGDAGLVAWDQKYSTDVDLWRPVSAIRLADIDNNPKTKKKANWLPLLDFTPPFPAYTSGHATFGAAHAAIMRNYFGTDNVTFTVGTDEPIVKSVKRTFTSFSEAGRENGVSRVYLGVHFRFDADIGYATGTALGNYVFRNFLRPVSGQDEAVVEGMPAWAFNTAYLAGDQAADLNSDGVVDPADYIQFVNEQITSAAGSVSN